MSRETSGLSEQQRGIELLISNWRRSIYGINNNNNNNNLLYPLDLVVLISNYSTYVVLFNEMSDYVYITNNPTYQNILFKGSSLECDICICTAKIELSHKVNIKIKSDINTNIFGLGFSNNNNLLGLAKTVLLVEAGSSGVEIIEYDDIPVC